MLEKVDLTKHMSKKEMKAPYEEACAKLSLLQRQCKDAGIPVMIVFEGIGAAGKGTQINSLIQPMDPRGFQVYATNRPTEDETMRPFLWRFWTKTPAKGRIAIFDDSWYRRVLTDRFDGITAPEDIETAFTDIYNFEKQLTDDGNVIIKLFLYISKKEQKKRMQRLLDNKETAWRVSPADIERNKNWDKYQNMTDEALQKTDTQFAPWTIIESEDREYAAMKIIATVVKRLETALEAKKNAPEPVKDSDLDIGGFKNGVLSGVDLSKKLTKEEYKKQLSELQKKLALLHSEIYRRRIPVIIAFEGWDAGGKGGAIKRLTSNLDPRGYAVHPTASPNDIERVHHYLWRFWNNVPKAGHIAIFDRTWYGRVMVERIEGFCSKDEWSRAYNEINQMEEHMVNAGSVVLKFWMQIDKDEQARRFKERQDIPEKQWKITDEDWRNREKWDSYEAAVDEMLVRTSTTYAPWVVVEANDKYYARIKVMETVAKAMEKAIKESAKRPERYTVQK